MAEIAPQSATAGAVPSDKAMENAAIKEYQANEISEDRSPSTEHDEKYEEIDESLQSGVRAVEAAASVWGRPHLISAFVIIWFIYVVASTQEGILRVLSPYITSTFALHSLTAAVSIMSSIIGGLTKIPLAKILDTWGRPQGLALVTLIWTLGIIMIAACKNVQTYAAAQVFATVGAQGVSYCVTVFIADVTSLKNRSLMLAIAASPYVFTTWIGGPITDSVIGGVGWRWGVGVWAIVTPIVVAPLCGLFFWASLRSKKLGLLTSERGKLTYKTVIKYIIDVDLLGILLLAGGMALFLLPFSLYSYQGDGWRSTVIICMIVFGGVLIIVFLLYEIYLAPVPFIPFSLLSDRTVFFGGLMLTFIFFNSMVWGSFFTSMLLVVWNQSPSQATYISNIYRTASCLAGLPIGYLIRRTERFKWVAVYFAIPLMILGVGLLIHFRTADSSIGYVVMTQIFIGTAGGPIVLAAQMAMMAPSDHQHIAVLIAILDLFCSVGTAVGSTVASAIWTGTFRQALERHLPEGAPIDRIYGSLYSQLGFRPGTEIRRAISLAYAESQRYMLITSTCALAGALICALLWRDIKLDSKQVKGYVV